MEGYSVKHRLRTVQKQVFQLPLQSSIRLPLSQAVLRFVTFCDERKILLVDRGVYQIDEIPAKFHGLETLYLSNNSIKDLTNLQQFPALKKLSLANNQIDTLEKLTPLSTLARLESVNFEGNRVALVPIYRDYVINSLRNLRFLDGVEVTETDRSQALVKLKQHSRIEDLVLKNEEEIAKLRLIKRRYEMHKELVCAGKLQFYRPSPLKKVAEMMETEWPETLSRQVRDGLATKAQHLLRDNPAQDWVWAYTQCLLSQQRVSAQLLTDCEEAESACSKLSQSAVPGSQMAHSVSERKVRKVRHTWSMPDKRKSVGTEDIHALIHISPRSQKDSGSLPTSRTSRTPRVYLPLGSSSPSFPKVTDPLCLSSREDQQRRKELEILREQVQDLKESEENRTKESVSAREKNEAVTRRVTESWEEMKRELAVSASRLDLAQARNKALQDFLLSFHLKEPMPVQKSINQALTDRVLLYRKRKVFLAVFKEWKGGVERGQKLKIFRRKIREEIALGDLAFWMEKWRKALIIKTFHNRAESRLGKQVIFAYFSWWKQWKRRETRISRLKANHNSSLIQLGFQAFLHHFQSVRRLQALGNKAKSLHPSHLLQRAVSSLVSYTQSWKFLDSQESALIEKAKSFRISKICGKTWSAWMEWRGRFGGKERQKLIRAYALYAYQLKKYGLQYLLSNAIEAKRRTALAIDMSERHIYTWIATWLGQMKVLRKRRVIKADQINESVHFRLKTVFSILHSAVQISISHKHILISLKSVRKFTLQRMTFEALLTDSANKKRLRSSAESVQLKVQIRRTRGYLFYWLSRMMRPLTKKQKIAQDFNRKILRKWSVFARMENGRKYRKQIGSRLFAAKVQKDLRTILKLWGRFCHKRNLLKTNETKLKKMKEIKAVCAAFSDWKYSYASTVSAKSQETRQIFREEQREKQRFQSENSELKREKEALRLTVIQLTSQTSDLQQTVESHLSALRSLESQAKTSMEEVKELKTALEEKQRELMQFKEEHEMMIETYDSEIYSTKTQMELTAQALRDKDQSLSQVSNQALYVQQEAEAMMQQLQDISEGLKSALRAKDQALQDAETLCDVLSSDLKKAENAVLEERKTRREETNQLREELEKAKATQADTTQRQGKDSWAPTSRDFPGWEKQESDRVLLSDESEKTLEKLHAEQAAIRSELSARMRRSESTQKRVSSPVSNGDRGVH